MIRRFTMVVGSIYVTTITTSFRESVKMKAMAIREGRDRPERP
jgi:hypothetical protein